MPSCTAPSLRSAPLPRPFCSSTRASSRCAPTVPNANDPTSRAASTKTPVPRADGASVHSHSAASNAGSSWRTWIRPTISFVAVRVITQIAATPLLRSRAARSMNSCTDSSLIGSSSPKRVASPSDSTLTRNGMSSATGSRSVTVGPESIGSAVRQAGTPMTVESAIGVLVREKATRRPLLRH